MRIIARGGAQPSRMCRRRFVQGMAAGTLLLGAGRLFGRTPTAAPKLLSGTQFDLSIDELAVNYTGAVRVATTATSCSGSIKFRLREP
ncbi:MAG: hypothetical protein ACLQFF_11305 [Steroidobacteraceae bacterium]|jgi:hypothetical protein